MSENEISGLVHRVNLALPAAGPRIVAFMAARSGEGTSTVAREFASGLAGETDQKVLLIDAGPLDRERFVTDGIDPSQGLAETGLDNDKTIRKIDYDLYLARWMGQEASRGAANRLLQDKNFWAQLQASFDTIVIDCPALQTSGDGIALATKADGVILVVEAEATRQPVIENLRDTLTAAGAKIAGSVMNKRRFYIPEKIYARL